MKLISFQITGRYGHFLRAEGGASALTYPVPPRTAILGIIGAVLGLKKDQSQILLEPAHIALSGKLPQMHWHKAKFRKDPPETLTTTIKRTQKTEKATKPEKATLIGQEWLFNPCYTVWISIPEPHFTDLERRLIEKRWHFQPSLGLSEMMAELNYLETGEIVPLTSGTHYVNSVFPHENGMLDMDRIFEDELVIHSLQMPRTVTFDRIFSHANYFMERDDRPMPVETSHAFKSSNRVLMFL
jgi:CRISPR-associated protein Cas5h